MKKLKSIVLSLGIVISGDVPRSDPDGSVQSQREFWKTWLHVATGCPFCMRMFTEEAAQEETGAPQILDLAEIVASKLRS